MYIEIKLFKDNAIDNEHPLMNQAAKISVESFNLPSEEIFQRHLQWMVERMKDFVSKMPKGA